MLSLEAIDSMKDTQQVLYLILLRVDEGVLKAWNNDTWDWEAYEVNNWTSYACPGQYTDGLPIHRIFAPFAESKRGDSYITRTYVQAGAFPNPTDKMRSSKSVRDDIKPAKAITLRERNVSVR